MSRYSKPMTAARLNDVVLGCFSLVKPSQTLDHLIRYLSTWSGSDKLFTVLQYTLKLLAPFFHLRARLQYRAGLRATPTSGTAASCVKFAGILGDSRTLWRLWGLLPIFQWLISLERNPPATRKLLTIERLQGWSMLAYYPLEHLSYLGSHGIIPATIPSPATIFSSKKKFIRLDPAKLGMWSCRFWGIYVVLQFAHLIEDWKLLKQRQSSIRKAKGTGLTREEKVEMHQRRDAFWSEVVTNFSNFPLTLHWSLEQGIFGNDIWVTIFSLIGGVASFRTGWNATALPPPPEPKEKSNITADNVVPYDMST
ncbi:hypothetical protein JR316_0005768 [Psilocybe cubensis]|uniref:Uncharacterized protein n=2 Tax=Psilocybe cubensis TaxID=181762 RepID=A0ACB8H085_PSICU|nr:hypothetical protein JR316_0005768 [Psilocybe cubensis]KAH9481246.1 hypothetical protein JR316_0005768 [Psilocybe cubensis]